VEAVLVAMQIGEQRPRICSPEVAAL